MALQSEDGLMISRTAAFSVFVVVALSLHCFAQEEERSSRSRPLHAVAEGYLANREKFSRFRMHYTLTVGSAATKQAALDGLFEGGAASAKVIWIVDEDRILFDKVVQPDVVETTVEAIVEAASSSRGKTTIAIPIYSEKRIQSGNGPSVVFSPLMNSGMFHAPGTTPEGIIMTPFDFGIMGAAEKHNPGSMISNGISAGDATYVGESTIDGHQAVTVRVSRLDGWHFVYALVPSRGYVPIRIDTISPAKRVARRVHVREFLFRDGAGWMAKDAVVLSNPDSASPPYPMERYRVTDLEIADAPIPDDHFVFEVPPGSYFNDGVDPESQLMISDGFVMTLQKLDELWLKIREESARKANAAKALQANPPTGWPMWLIWLNVAVIALFSLAWMTRIGVREKH